MKRKLIKAGVLLVIFAAALVVSSLVINRGTGDEIVDMGAPSIPRISFLLDGKTVNTLSGYSEEMEIPSMRDTIIPLGEDGSLTMGLEEGRGSVSGIRYEVCADRTAGRGGAESNPRYECGPDGQLLYEDHPARRPGGGRVPCFCPGFPRKGHRRR